MALLNKANNELTELAAPGFCLYGGKHCETSALQKVMEYSGYNISEEMLFGLGGGIGFVYWFTKKMPVPFIGGRNGTFPEFLNAAAERVGISMEIVQTQSEKKAYEGVRQLLSEGRPAIVYGDIAYLPYFMTPRHFGGHAFVIYGIDEKEDIAAVSDRGQHPYYLSLSDLRQARSSSHPPFKPKNAFLKITCPTIQPDLGLSVRSAIQHCSDAMINAPISNLGLKGFNKFANMVIKWPSQFDTNRLLHCLMETYINLELAGTGGAAFRNMYTRFLHEASQYLDEKEIVTAASLLERSAEGWRKIACSLLPDSCTTLKAIREKLVERNNNFELLHPQALVRMQELTAKIESLKKEACAEVSRAKDFLGVTRAEVLRCCELETEVFTKLSLI